MDQRTKATLWTVAIAVLVVALVVHHNITKQEIIIFCVVVPSIIQGLANIRAFGHALLIAESNIHHLPDFADRLYVIERGEVIFAGRPKAAIEDPVVARVVGGTARSPHAAGPIEEGPGDVIDV